MYISIRTLLYLQDVWNCKGPLVHLNDLNKLARDQINLLRSKITELENIANEVDHERVRIDLKQMVENQTRQLQLYVHLFICNITELNT